MARCLKILALALALAAGACSSSSGNTGPTTPDAPSSLCVNSSDCLPGHWCNPKPVDSIPTDTICEPRGATNYSFDLDIYPTIASMCAGCHVANVPDSMGGTISVFAGGPDVAFASLTADGTTCDTTTHRVCVDEPKKSSAVARLLTHLDATSAPGSKLLPMGYSDPWMQKFLHWIAAGAHRDNNSVS